MIAGIVLRCIWSFKDYKNFLLSFCAQVAFGVRQQFAQRLLFVYRKAVFWPSLQVSKLHIGFLVV